MLTMPFYVLFIFRMALLLNMAPCKLVRRYQRYGGVVTSFFRVSLRQPEDEAARCTITLLHIQQSTQRHIAEDFSSAAVRNANLAFMHFV